MPQPWGKAIEALRLEKRLTRAALAKRAHMTPTVYGRIERGGHTYTRKLLAIADALEVPIERVLMASTPTSTGGAVDASTDQRIKEAVAEAMRKRTDFERLAEETIKRFERLEQQVKNGATKKARASRRPKPGQKRQKSSGGGGK